MIRDQLELEAALEQAIALMNTAPKLGTPEDRRLMELLAAIQKYQPEFSDLRDAPNSARLEALSSHLDRFQKRREQGAPEPGSAGQGGGRFRLPD